jgi:hypothetical protein
MIEAAIIVCNIWFPRNIAGYTEPDRYYRVQSVAECDRLAGAIYRERTVWGEVRGLSTIYTPDRAKAVCGPDYKDCPVANVAEMDARYDCKEFAYQHGYEAKFEDGNCHLNLSGTWFRVQRGKVSQ